ncbi:MAG: sugar transferase [Alphaproteobacteria bacterium]|nr:sugar transferase [Alphaproteobacteria bacterium]
MLARLEQLYLRVDTEIGDDRASIPVPSLRRSKRLFDVVFALLLILLFAPLAALVALLVSLDGGPILFGHVRVGANGRPFRCWKFRSMCVDADERLREMLASDPLAREEWARDHKLRKDPRVTRLGRVLRLSSLDELPQLLNVLTGSMSLVGPRPIVEAEIPRYGSAFVAYCKCRPGVTGLWQVMGRNNVSYARRVQLDNAYARHSSLKMDLLILLRTVVIVIRTEGVY